MKNIIKRAKALFFNTCIIDRLLMIYMLILLLYTAFNLFFGPKFSSDSTPLDILVRTSAAAIFGYFVSGNFVTGRTSDADLSKAVSQKDVNEQNKNEDKINPELTPSDPSLQANKTELPNQNNKGCTSKYNKVQITVVAAIGIFSLIILLAADKMGDIAEQSPATVSQLRDFVSACVGFLVSCAKVR